MRLKFALIALATLGGGALPAGTASAMPIGLATNADIATNIDEVRLVCNGYGCWRVPGHAYGYYGGPTFRYGHGGGYWRHGHGNGHGYGDGHGHGDGHGYDHRRW